MWPKLGLLTEGLSQRRYVRKQGVPDPGSFAKAGEAPEYLLARCDGF